MDVQVLLLPCAHLLVQIKPLAKRKHISGVHLLYNIIVLILAEILLHAPLCDVVHQRHHVAGRVMRCHVSGKMTQHIVGRVDGIIIVNHVVV